MMNKQEKYIWSFLISNLKKKYMYVQQLLLKNGFGVVLDDVLAGIFTAITYYCGYIIYYKYL